MSENGHNGPLVLPEATEVEQAVKEAARHGVPPAEVLPVLPLNDTVLFPAMMAPLTVATRRSIVMVEEADAGDKYLLTTLQKDPRTKDDEVQGGDLHEFGCVVGSSSCSSFPTTPCAFLCRACGAAG